MKAQTIRKQIGKTLKTHENMSVCTFAWLCNDVIGKTGAGVRRELNKMVAEGKVEATISPVDGATIYQLVSE